jgi:hypothetical protein
MFLRGWSELEALAVGRISAYDFSRKGHVFSGVTSFHHTFSLRTTS